MQQVIQQVYDAPSEITANNEKAVDNVRKLESAMAENGETFKDYYD